MSYCPECEGNHAVEVKCDEIINPRSGGVFTIKDFEYTYCHDCGVEFVNHEQRKANDKKIRVAKEGI